MKKAEMNVVRFGNKDVIATSGTTYFVLGGLADGTKKNLSFTFDGTAVAVNDTDVFHKDGTAKDRTWSDLKAKEESAGFDTFNGNYLFVDSKYVWQSSIQ